MNYDKGYFESPEFREILKKYEQANQLNTTPYYGVDELIDLFSYFIYIEKLEEAAKILSTSRRLHPDSLENTKMEVLPFVIGGALAVAALGVTGAIVLKKRKRS